MNKTFVSVIAIIGLCICIFAQICFATPMAVESSSEPIISVEPSYLKVSPSDVFTVNITIDPDGVEILGAQYTLYFNNSLNATSQTKGPFLSQDGASTMEISNVINNTIGKMDYGEFRSGVDYGINTSSVLATITFEAKKAGTSSLSLSNVILSDEAGVQIPGVLINNGSCKIEAVAQTPTLIPTPTLTSTSTLTSISPSSSMPTSTPISTEQDDGNDSTSVTPALTQILKPAQNPVLSLSPSLSPTIITSPAPSASKPLPPSEENKRLPGFEAAFAVIGLLAISSFVSKRRGQNKK